jgi:hypothetical protein
MCSRCFVAWESKTPLKLTEKQQLSRPQTEYDTRLKEANIDDTRSFKDEVWSYWPKVDLGQILSFVLSRKELCGALKNSESIFILPVWFC